MDSKSNILRAPHILLPKKGVDLSRFAVIACDQFTSQVDYWNHLKTWIGAAPSAFKMIFPEAYLPLVDNAAYIHQINQTIDEYLKTNVLEDIGECFILVERKTPFVPCRLGLMVSIDLEAYTFEKGIHSPIRASEATILDRLPPRLKIREHAPVEIPHALLLVDDPKKEIIEGLYSRRNEFPCVYDFELNQNGGHLRGYKITDTKNVIQAFYNLVKGKKDDLLFIVGDGNHSIATAKAHWDKLKVGLSEEERKTHPARYTLAEVINLYDDGLLFEPIHRVVFHAGEDFIPGLEKVLTGDYHGALYTHTTGKIPQRMPMNSPLAYKIVQDYVDGYVKSHTGSNVDYIHGVKDLFDIADANPDAVAIEMPVVTKSDIFAYIAAGDVLPRKCFSMGHAPEKRYYLESKRII